jgi:hypothetical protein
MIENPEAPQPEKNAGGNPTITHPPPEPASPKDRNKGIRYYRRYASQVLKNFSPPADQSIAIATWVLVAVTVVAIVCTERDFERTQRAWIAPVGAMFADEAFSRPDMIRVQISFKNPGKEPATDINQNLDGITVPIPPGFHEWDSLTFGPNNTCDGLEVKRGHAVAYPDDPNIPEVEFEVVPKDDPSKVIRDIETGERIFILRGCFAYTAVRERHVSAFCYFLLPVQTVKITDWKFKTCPTGNYAD